MMILFISGISCKKNKMITSFQNPKNKYEFLNQSKNDVINNKKKHIHAKVIINNPSDIEKLKKVGIKIINSNNSIVDVELPPKMLFKLSSQYYVQRIIIDD